jgi:hypothetical protein
MKYAFAILWVVGTSFIVWIAVRIKRIQMDSANLYVSTGFKEIAVPIMEIGSVKELWWIKGHPITIGLKNATACGTSVMFPYGRRIAATSRVNSRFGCLRARPGTRRSFFRAGRHDLSESRSNRITGVYSTCSRIKG